MPASLTGIKSVTGNDRQSKLASHMGGRGPNNPAQRLLNSDIKVTETPEAIVLALSFCDNFVTSGAKEMLDDFVANDKDGEHKDIRGIRDLLEMHKIQFVSRHQCLNPQAKGTSRPGSCRIEIAPQEPFCEETEKGKKTKNNIAKTKKEIGKLMSGADNMT